MEVMTSKCGNCGQSHPNLRSPSSNLPGHIPGCPQAQNPGTAATLGQNSRQEFSLSPPCAHPKSFTLLQSESPPASQRMQLMESGCFPLKARPNIPGRPRLPPLYQFLGPPSKFLPGLSPAQQR